jgi:hypothetical protein
MIRSTDTVVVHIPVDDDAPEMPGEHSQMGVAARYIRKKANGKTLPYGRILSLIEESGIQSADGDYSGVRSNLKNRGFFTLA